MECINSMHVLIVQCSMLFLQVLPMVYTKQYGVIPLARCRSSCLSKFLKTVVDDEECNRLAACSSCWNICDAIIREPEVWKKPCRNKNICNEGCQAACQFRKTLSKTMYSVQTRWFTETPAVTTEPRMQQAYIAWSKPVLTNTVSNPQEDDSPDLVYVLLARDRQGKDRSWEQILQTSSTFAIIDVMSLPYYPEFWLLAVGDSGTQAEQRFNASISRNLFKPDIIEIGEDNLDLREGGVVTVLYDPESTLNITITMSILDGVLIPTLTWTNPPVQPKKGNQLVYEVHYYLNRCKCAWPADHFSRIVVVLVSEQPTITLDDIAFSAEYLVEIELKSDKVWRGEITFTTPFCPKTPPLNPAKCEEDLNVNQKVVAKSTTPPKTTLETLVNNTVALDADHLEQSDDLFSLLMGTASSHGLEWNITSTDMKYDSTRQKVLVSLQWSLPFNHSLVSQELVWTNTKHTDRVDAGRVQHVPKAADSTSETLELQPFSQYNIYVLSIYTDENGDQQEIRSRVLVVNTNITEETPHVSVARLTAIDQEKEILNGIILGVTVVSSVIIFGIIILFIYKKRQSFRDIIITKTAVAKSNSYKSNVGYKVDYSNQVLIPSDDWEVDCRQLKFASHIGQGAFGKVVTGYYKDQRVAIKLVRDCAPISYKEDLLAEIALMKRLGSHPNIVSMVGACTMVEPICLVMEYVPYGNLQNFLKKCRLEGELTIQAGRSPQLNYSIMDEHGGINEGIVTPADLLSFARQVAMAMEYLGEKKYVHRDLAARNVLLGYDKIIKVCDFGLSRDIYNDHQYKKLTNGKLPLKWMAVESLRDRVFTTQSDVWSFGILLWEIVTMGASPYPNIALADLYYLLSNSYRMDKPSNCSDELYIIMRQCWLENSTDRPTFTDLRVQLELLLTRDRNYLDLDNINVPLSTPESSSGSPASDDTKSLLAAQALQPQRKLSKDELTVNVSIHDKSVERLLRRKGDFDAHNITIL